MKRKSLEELAASIAADLNNLVFPIVDQALVQQPSLRPYLNPAFPFPLKMRIGALDTHLVVEYVGPEDPKSEQVNIEAVWRPDLTVYEFLGIEVDHLSHRAIPYPHNVENLQVFLGEAMSLLGDYMYDIVANPNDLMLNGFPAFTTASEPTFVSNTSFLWSDPNGALRIRRIDFMELFPITAEGWGYHTEESLRHFANFIINYRVPPYRPALHSVLNDFIQLVAAADSSEPTITAFLSDHPEILQLAFGANELNPQTDLIWQYPTKKSDLKPDFLPVKMDGYADILEFKLPRLKGAPLVGTATRSHPSFEVDSALSQIDDYAEWCEQEVNRRWLEETKGIRLHRPHTCLVIGHRDDFTAADRQKLRSRRNATIFTYDEFIEMARMQLYRVR